MNTRRTTARRVGEEIANVGATPQGNWVRPQVQATANYKVLVNPSAIKDGEVREDLFEMSRDITTHAKSIDAQANREVVPLEN